LQSIRSKHERIRGPALSSQTDADALHSLAQTACQQGRLAEGIGYARQALAVDPGRARSHLLLGMALARIGRPEEALASFDRAIALAPELAGAHGNRGDALAEMGRQAEAIESYDRALGIAPQSLENWCNRAAALLELGRSAEALASYDRALAIKPDHVDVLVARGVVLDALGRQQEAVASFDRALVQAPDHQLALRTRGVALLKLDRFEEALASFERVAEQSPADADALYNVAFTLAALDRDSEALAAFDQVLAANPDHIDALMGRGAALQNLCRYADAIATYERVVAIDPNHAEAHYSEAMALLSLGHYRSGLTKYEWRRKVKGTSIVQTFAKPLWLGDVPIEGKTLLLHAEQGIGDVLYAVRYLPLLARRGARIILQVQASLRELLSRLEGVGAVAGRGDLLPPFDYHCPLMSLPHALKTEPAAIPADVPYIDAPQERVALWRDRLPDTGKLRVGLVWCGNPAFKEDRRRSLKLAQVAPLLATPDISFYSLNPGIGEGDVAALAARPNVLHLGSQFRDFSDTAAVVSLLDLVVTSDTSVAHLAGAMGRPVWIMLGFSPDWRWAFDRDRSFWYPTARLFHQDVADDWAGVIARVQHELSALSGG
jgi:tetratricopeptide (TPR) repeat protein